MNSKGGGRNNDKEKRGRKKRKESRVNKEKKERKCTEIPKKERNLSDRNRDMHQ